jgi:hypothetical protein
MQASMHQLLGLTHHPDQSQGLTKGAKVFVYKFNNSVGNGSAQDKRTTTKTTVRLAIRRVDIFTDYFEIPTARE